MARWRTAAVLLTVACGPALIAAWWFGAPRWFVSPDIRPTGGRSTAAETQPPRNNPFLPAGAADRGWPFLRGPDCDGHSAEVRLADGWPASGPPVLWSRSLGQGYSAFVARADRVFTQYQTLAGQYVICLDADTGRTVWEYRYDWPYEAAGIYPGPRASPTIAGNRIYFAAPSGLVGCLSWTGDLIWELNVRERFHGRGTDFGYSCSPVVRNGRVLLPVGGPGASMVALDARDGAPLWQSGDDPASYTPALPIEIDGHEQVVGYLENALASFDMESGRQLWRFELSRGYDEHAAWPVFVEPYLWISGPFRSGSKLLRLGGADAPVSPVWESRLLSNDLFSSVSYEGMLFGFDLKDVQAKAHRPSRGQFRCIELSSGNPMWETEQIGHASVLVADGKLILFNDQGELILARASPDSYQELGRASVLAGQICWTPPALDRGRLYVRNQSQAACLFIGRPELLEREQSSGAMTVADIPQGNYRNLAAVLGVEPEYAFDVPSDRSFGIWFGTGLGLLGLAAACVLAADWFWRIGSGRQVSKDRTWGWFWIAAFVLGAVCTTPLGLWRSEFVFTWPVALFVAFQATIRQVRVGSAGGNSSNGWRSRLMALGFIGVCLIYYLLCRRVSLVFEWAFLSGFGAAVPLALAGRWLSARAPRWLPAAAVFTPVEFAAYYWGSVAWLWWKYPGAG